MTDVCIRERGGRFVYIDTEETQGRRPDDDEGGDWKDAATSQEAPRIAGSHQN